MLPRDLGHYRLLDLLGSGGMGEVFRATDTRRDRQVALKLLPGIFSEDEEYQRRFRSEAYTAARLREPHIIPIHDFGEIDGRLFIDMRLVDDGRDIRRVLDESGPLDPARAVGLISQIALALDAAHADGLVHRDIKPSNLLVTGKDFVYVVDFGIARSVGTSRTSLTVTGATVGTLDYMAPERFSEGPVDGRADIYSLSCLLHECLSGRRPFAGEDLPSLMYAHLNTEPPVPSAVIDTVPVALDAVVAKGMAKQPGDRYPTAGALAAAAGAALLGGSSSSARSSSTGTTVVLGSSGSPAPTPIADRRPQMPGVAEVAGMSDRSQQPVVVGATTGPSPGRVADDEVTVVIPPAPPGPVGAASRSRRYVLALAAVVAVIAVIAVVIGVSNSPRTDRPSDGPRPTPPGIKIADSLAEPAAGNAVSIGTAPGDIAIAGTGKILYVTDESAVLVVDSAKRTVITAISTPQGAPRFVTVAPSGQQLYVGLISADPATDLVAVIDTETNTVTSTITTGRGPSAAVATPDGRVLFVANQADDQVEVIETSTPANRKLIPIIAPTALGLNSSGRFLYIASSAGAVTVVDTSDNSTRAKISVGSQPNSLAISPDGGRLVTSNTGSNDVSVIDTLNDAPIATVKVGKRPVDVAFAADGRHLYVANFDDDTLSVLSTTSNAVTATVPTGDGPTGIVVRPGGRQTLVTVRNSGKLLVVRTAD